MKTPEELDQAGAELFDQLVRGVDGVDYRGKPVRFILNKTHSSIDVMRENGLSGIYPVHSFVEAIAVSAGINPEYEEVNAIEWSVGWRWSEWRTI